MGGIKVAFCVIGSQEFESIYDTRYDRSTKYMPALTPYTFLYCARE